MGTLKKLEKVFSGRQFKDDWPPVKAKEFIAWFSEKLRAVPKEWRGDVLIEISAVEIYDSNPLSRIEISYLRDETEEEIALEEARSRKLAKLQEARELQILADLKAKYESN